MCGIAGAFTLGERRPIDRRRLARMTAALRHRGPDGEGTFERPGIVLGHRRLAIVDVAGGAQPIANEDGRVVVVANGEIYNHRALRAELEGRGHRFRTRSDSEAIVHAYEEWGEECASRFEGKFAFAVYDGRADALFLARDRLGVKPLFVATSDDGVGGSTFVFASEPKGIRAFEDAPRPLDREAIEDSLLVGFVLGERTSFAGVRRIEGGTALLVGRDGVRERRTWDLRFGGEPAAAEDVAAAVTTAVEDRLMSDVPIAACLSGGLDSSLIVALAQRRLERPLRTLGVRFHGSEGLAEDRAVEGLVGDDAVWARRVAAHLATDHVELELPRGDYLAGLDEAVAHREKPLLSPAEFGLLRVAAAAKAHASVLLSGQGADEIFGGYYYWTERRTEANTPFFPWVFRPFGSGRIEDAHAPAELFAALLGPRRAARAWERLRDEWSAWKARAGAATFDQTLLYLMVKLHLAEQLEHEDALKMAHGVELRVPFVDHRVVTRVANLSPEARAAVAGGGDGLEKPLLRRLARSLLPPEVVRRKKSPFPHPIGVVEEERAMADVLARAGLDDLLEPEALRCFLRDYEAPASYAKRQVLFKAYTLARFVEQASARASSASR